MADKNVTRQLSIYINDKEVVNSLAGIGREIGSVSARMRTLNKDSETYDEDLQKLKGTLEDLKTRHSYLKDEIYGTDQALGSSMHSLEGVEKRMQDLSKEMRLLDANSEDYTERLQAMGDEYKTLEDRQKKYRDVIAATTKIQTKQVNSLAGVEAEMQQVRAEMNNLDRDSSNYREELTRLQTEYTGLQERQQEFQTEIAGTTEVIQEQNHELGAANNAFSNIFNGIKNGDIDMVKSGFSGIKAGIMETAKAGMAFIATPVGATIAALVAAFGAAKYIWDFNQSLIESNNQLTSLGVKSKELSAVRSEIMATAETYEKEFTEISEKANTLAEAYSISMTQANAIIAEGLADGGAKNDEYLESIGEYSVFFAKAGYSAKEFINILNSGQEIGIFSDKLPDALKEADLALKEQTVATKDALVNAFGANFSNEILARVKSGETTTKEALEEIAAKSKEVNLTQQQEAQLTADVFKGAGEDAGGALKIFEAIGKAATRELSESAKASEELRAANERLNKVQAQLFEIENFGDMWTMTKTAAVETMADIMESIAAMKEDIQPLIELVGIIFVGAWLSLKHTVTTAFHLISAQFRLIGNIIGTFVNVAKKLLQGDFSGALNAVKDGIIRVAQIIDSTFGGIKNSIINGLKGIVSAVAPVLDALGLDVEKIQKKLESWKVKEVKVKATVEDATAADQRKITEDLAKRAQEQIDLLTKKKNKLEALGMDTFKTEEKILQLQQTLYKKDSAEYENVTNQLLKLRTDRNKKATDEAKKAADEEQKIKDANAKIFAKGEEEINKLIAKSQADRTAGQLTGLAKELAQIEAKWATEREKYKEHLTRLAEIDAAKDAEMAAAKAAKAKEYGLQIDQINAELERDREALRLDKLAAEAVEDEDKQAILLEKAKFLADWELQSEMDKELAKVEAVENAEQLKQAIRDKYAQKKQNNDLKFGETEKAIKKDQVKFTDMTEKQKYAFITSNLNNISEAFNKGSVAWKALKIAETTISTFQTSQEAFRGMVSAFPGPVGIALGAAAATAAGVRGLKQVQSIAKTKLEKAPKFFKGGPTGDKVLFPDEYGGAVGVVHKNEWVAPEYMTKDPRYANVIKWLENERVRNNGYASGGSASAPGSAADVIASASESSIMNELLSAVTLLNSLLQSGITVQTNIGYREVKDMDTLRDEIQQSKRNGTLNS